MNAVKTKKSHFLEAGTERNATRYITFIKPVATVTSRSFLALTSYPQIGSTLHCSRFVAPDPVHKLLPTALTHTSSKVLSVVWAIMMKRQIHHPERLLFPAAAGHSFLF
jgi:hypothetical protein